jgi:hypothetical protein
MNKTSQESPAVCRRCCHYSPSLPSSHMCPVPAQANFRQAPPAPDQRGQQCAQGLLHPQPERSDMVVQPHQQSSGEPDVVRATSREPAERPEMTCYCDDGGMDYIVMPGKIEYQIIHQHLRPSTTTLMVLLQAAQPKGDLQVVV